MRGNLSQDLHWEKEGEEFLSQDILWEIVRGEILSQDLQSKMACRDFL